MKQPSFLARTTLGLPNYLLVAMAAVFMLAMAPLGARQAIQGRSNHLESWLPASNGVAADRRWFDEQFDGDQFILVSWDECTLGAPAKLATLARKLELLTIGRDATLARIVTGPQLIDQLTAPPYGLAYEGAIERLQGTFVGPLPRDARGASLGHSLRTTCLAATLTPTAAASDAVVATTLERIRAVAHDECGIEASSLRMAGPALDSLRIGQASIASLLGWGMLAVAMTTAICLARLQSFRLAALAVVPALASAAMTLAIVYYSGVLEALAFGRAAPLVGVADALTAAAPLLVFALTLAMSLRLLYYYRDARLGEGIDGAAERAVADGWPAWALTALLFAAAMGAFCLSELLPLRRFGLFAGLGMLASVGAVLSIMPVWLHRFPIDDREIRAMAGPRGDGAAPGWLASMFEIAISGRGVMAAAAIAVLGLAALGMTKLEPATRLPTAVSGRSTLASDYDWFGARMGHAVPMEIILTVPTERNREPHEHPEADGQQYRLTLLERMELTAEVERRIRGLEEISGAVSPATFLPAGNEINSAATVRDDLARLDLVRNETRGGGELPTGRELWRTSARLAASTPGRDADYAATRQRLRAAVDPVLRAYEQRDWLVRDLHERGAKLEGAAICILFRGADDTTAPAAGTPETTLANLLNRSGVQRTGISFLNLTPLDKEAAGEKARERALDPLRRASAAILLSDADDATATFFRANGVNIVSLGTLPSVEESATQPLVEIGGPRPIRALLTGDPMVAIAASDELTATFDQVWQYALAGLAIAMACVVWHPLVGLVTVAAVLFPLATMLGAMGWLGIEFDMGIVLVAGLAAGLSIDGAVHYVAWFRRGLRAGLFRHEAARMAMARCAPATLDATLAVGIGFALLWFSQITFAQQLGLAALGVGAAAAVGVLLMLPAILASPLGHLMGAELAPESVADGVGSIRLAPAAEGREADRHADRTDVAAASVPAPNHRGRTPQPVADDRYDAIESPHAALQAKLQRLRRAGE